MKAHIGERGDEVEQHPEADRVNRQQPRIAQMREHLPGRGGKTARADKASLAWQCDGDDHRADQRQQRDGAERRAPADQIGDRAGDETAAEAADARSGNEQSGDARHVGRRPFIADIGNGDGEDRRQQQPLDEAQQHELRHARRQRHDQRRHHDGKGGEGDQPLAAENVGQRAGERALSARWPRSRRSSAH